MNTVLDLTLHDLRVTFCNRVPRILACGADGAVVRARNVAQIRDLIQAVRLLRQGSDLTAENQRQREEIDRLRVRLTTTSQLVSTLGDVLTQTTEERNLAVVRAEKAESMLARVRDQLRRTESGDLQRAYEAHLTEMDQLKVRAEKAERALVDAASIRVHSGICHRCYPRPPLGCAGDTRARLMEDELAEANSRAEKAERLASEHDNARKRAEMFERDMLVWKERAQQAYQAMDRIAEERDRALEATRSAGHKVDCGIDDDRRYLHETLRQALQRMHEMSAENGTLQDENAVLRATLSQYTRSSSTSTTDTRVVSHDWIPTPEGRTECGRCGRERSRVDDLDEPCPRPAPRRVEEPDALKLERAIQQAEKVVARKSGG